ncbi:MAG: NADH-quinone oxidoreductase subunit A [Candidatus Omnitrophica bacterium]|nr:NADH-quinone oxidoreductase subunit A [Candidatus Omnitrophota bacterium]
MVEYASLLIVFAVAGGVAALLLVSSAILGPKRPNPAKSQPFECGEQPFALPQGGLPVKFYILAMLFIIFDVELVFLFPWAVILRELGWFGIGGMFTFMLFVVAGFVYAWKKGALEFE